MSNYPYYYPGYPLVTPLLCPFCTDGVLVVHREYPAGVVPDQERLECDQCDAVFCDLGLYYPGWVREHTHRRAFHDDPNISELVAQGWRFCVYGDTKSNLLWVDPWHKDRKSGAQDRSRRERLQRHRSPPWLVIDWPQVTAWGVENAVKDTLVLVKKLEMQYAKEKATQG